MTLFHCFARPLQNVNVMTTVHICSTYSSSILPLVNVYKLLEVIVMKLNMNGTITQSDGTMWKWQTHAWENAFYSPRSLYESEHGASRRREVLILNPWLFLRRQEDAVGKTPLPLFASMFLISLRVIDSMVSETSRWNPWAFLLKSYFLQESIWPLAWQLLMNSVMHSEDLFSHETCTAIVITIMKYFNMYEKR